MNKTRIRLCFGAVLLLCFAVGVYSWTRSSTSEKTAQQQNSEVHINGVGQVGGGCAYKRYDDAGRLTEYCVSEASASQALAMLNEADQQKIESDTSNLVTIVGEYEIRQENRSGSTPEPVYKDYEVIHFVNITEVKVSGLQISR